MGSYTENVGFHRGFAVFIMRIIKGDAERLIIQTRLLYDQPIHRAYVEWVTAEVPYVFANGDRDALAFLYSMISQCDAGSKIAVFVKHIIRGQAGFCMICLTLPSARKYAAFRKRVLPSL